MLRLEIMERLDEDVREELYELWDMIGELEDELGCRATRYAIHRFYSEAVDDNEEYAIIVYGRKGLGKSTYAIKTLATYYMRREEMSCGEAYQEALKALAFSPRDLLSIRAPIVIWDDAGVWGSTYLWYNPVMRPYLEVLVDWNDVVRGRFHVLVMTTPTRKKLPPSLRDEPDAITIRISKHGYITYAGRRIKQAVARAYRNLDVVWKDKPLKPEIFKDHFTAHLPDPVYQFYQPIRDAYRQYVEERLARILDILDKIMDKAILLELQRRGIYISQSETNEKQ